MKRATFAAAVLLFGPVGWAVGQSSSLFREYEARREAEASATTRPAANGAVAVNTGAAIQPASQRNTNLAKHSLTAVSAPEPAVIKVNDLIGVIVRHRFRSKTDAKLEQESEWNIAAKLDAWFRIHDRRWLQQEFRGGKPEVKFTNENELENEGRSDRRDLLETRLMGKVIDVKPNGNLMIVAAYSIDTGEDAQTLVVSGEVHSLDINPDRTVTSDRIFGLKIGTAPTGAVSDAIKRGWFKEILDKVKPF